MPLGSGPIEFQAMKSGLSPRARRTSAPLSGSLKRSASVTSLSATDYATISKRRFGVVGHLPEER